MDTQTFLDEAAKLERMLFRIGWSMLGEDCADAVQEALLRAWQKRETLRDMRCFRSWMTRIMVNVCNGMLRKRAGERWVPLEEHMAVTEPPDGERGALDESLQRLTPEHRAVLVLHYLEGYRVREIAQMLDIPTGTVKTRLRAARGRMHRELTDHQWKEGAFSHEKA